MDRSSNQTSETFVPENRKSNILTWIVSIIAVVLGIGWYNAAGDRDKAITEAKEATTKAQMLASENSRLVTDKATLAGQVVALTGVNLDLKADNLRLASLQGKTKHRLDTTRTQLAKEQLRREGADRTAKTAVKEAHRVGVKQVSVKKAS